MRKLEKLKIKLSGKKEEKESKELSEKVEKAIGDKKEKKESKKENNHESKFSEVLQKLDFSEFVPAIAAEVKAPAIKSDNAITESRTSELESSLASVPRTSEGKGQYNVSYQQAYGGTREDSSSDVLDSVIALSDFI